MPKSAVINVALTGDASKLKKTLKGADSDVSSFSSKLGGMAKIAGTAFAGLGVAGVGALFKLGSTFQDVERTIRAGTGATGEALDGLVGVAKNVATQVPASFDQIATAVADTNTRLGLTGDELDAFSVQMLNLSKLTDADLSVSIEKMGRLMGDWAASAGTAESAADDLFTVAQATGIEFSTLADQMTKYGAPLRTLGFDFEDAALLIGKFNAEGVNTELVMGGLRAAMGKWATDSVDPIQAFKDVQDAIQNAGTAAEANAISVETFGSRAGVDMATAILEGKFALEDYHAVLEDGHDTINVAAEDSETLGDKLRVMGQQVQLFFLPVAEKMTDWLGQLIDKFNEWKAPIREVLTQIGQRLSPSVTVLRDKFGETWEALQNLVAAFKGSSGATLDVKKDIDLVAEAAGALNTGIAILTDMVDGVNTFFLLLERAVLAVGAAIERTIEGIKISASNLHAFLIKPLQDIMDLLDAIGSGIVGGLGKAAGWIGGIFQSANKQSAAGVGGLLPSSTMGAGIPSNDPWWGLPAAPGSAITNWELGSGNAGPPARDPLIQLYVAGSVTTERQLVETIREGLLNSQQSGRQLVL